MYLNALKFPANWLNQEQHSYKYLVRALLAVSTSTMKTGVKYYKLLGYCHILKRNQKVSLPHPTRLKKMITVMTYFQYRSLFEILCC